MKLGLKEVLPPRTHIAKSKSPHLGKISQITTALCGFKSVTWLHGKAINQELFQEPVTCKRCQESSKAQAQEKQKKVSKK